MAKQLSVANIEYAGGKSAKGTKVKLSDGSYLAGVSFVETTRCGSGSRSSYPVDSRL